MTNKDKDQVLIPMVTTIEAALDYGYSMKDIRLWRIGNRMCTVILVPGTKEQYDSYLSSFSKGYGTLTFSDLTWTNEDGIEEAYEPVAPEGYGSAERYLELLQELMGYVGAIRPEYAPVVKLLSDGLSRREIAKELGVPKSTIIDWVKKIQELTLKFMEDII